eukprot:TRINITY_DN109_c0_g2_i2.p1 TRINITY_DN109_c0_g2~~TRINITY_DN109_c0_g2_i2.p1  ORF type:complete len:671 (+),score=132.16 TRINITY_DN109_c0_g2_i2:124-2013(+)
MYGRDNPQATQSHYPNSGTSATPADPNVYNAFHQGQGQHQVYQQDPGHHMQPQQPQPQQQQYRNPIPVYNVAPTPNPHQGPTVTGGPVSGHRHPVPRNVTGAYSHPAAHAPPHGAYPAYPNGVLTAAMGVAVAAPPSTVAPFIKSIKKRKPGPLRKKCVWCSLTHGHSCNTNKCAVRLQLGGIGSSELLERCRILKREVGEEVRIALAREGTAGIDKLERSLWERKMRDQGITAASYHNQAANPVMAAQNARYAPYPTQGAMRYSAPNHYQHQAAYGQVQSYAQQQQQQQQQHQQQQLQPADALSNIPVPSSYSFKGTEYAPQTPQPGQPQYYPNQQQQRQQSQAQQMGYQPQQPGYAPGQSRSMGQPQQAPQAQGAVQWAQAQDATRYQHPQQPQQAQRSYSMTPTGSSERHAAYVQQSQQQSQPQADMSRLSQQQYAGAHGHLHAASVGHAPPTGAFRPEPVQGQIPHPPSNQQEAQPSQPQPSAPVSVPALAPGQTAAPSQSPVQARVSKESPPPPPTAPAPTTEASPAKSADPATATTATTATTTTEAKKPSMEPVVEQPATGEQSKDSDTKVTAPAVTSELAASAKTASIRFAQESTMAAAKAHSDGSDDAPTDAASYPKIQTA